jgi:hypothetical protein
MAHCIKMTVNDVQFCYCVAEFLMRKNNSTAGIFDQVGFEALTTVVTELYFLGCKAM